MTTLTRAGPAIQTYRIYIKAPPQAIWDALTRPGWTVKYGYRSPVRYNLWRGGAYRMFASYSMREQGAPEVIIEGEVLEADPPRLLAQTWHALFGPETAAEAVTRLTWQIEADSRGVSTLSLTHQLDDAPITAELVAGEVSVAGGGWSWILSDLKSLLKPAGRWRAESRPNGGDTRFGESTADHEPLPMLPAGSDSPADAAALMTVAA